MQIERVRYTAKSHISVGSGLLSRLFALLFSGPMTIGLSGVMLAQQPGGITGSNQIWTKTDA